ncbi:MAG: methyltransferase domain-containing protein [Actinomycetota bacterium]|nr:methyltransferase domain-containing protein [Actinomycetota bacterium]
MSATADSAAAREAIARNPLWYHTIEVVPGVVTPGVFDLRPVVGRLPWPDVRGKRCLDVGTYDGFLAFELERRGAAEVVATDVSSHAEWDHEVRLGRQSIEFLETIAGEKGAGIATARELLGSSVEKVEINAYELTPDRVGHFDVVVCGSLLLHLRDPLRALAAIRSVCSDRFMSIEQVDFLLTRVHPRRPLVRIDGTSGAGQWWVGNAAGHIRMLEAAGFDVERRTPMYMEPLGVGHPGHGRSARGALALAARMLGRGDGVPHAAALTRRA